MNSEICWISPKWPLPANDGARIATCSLIKGLVEHSLRINLLSCVSDSDINHEQLIQQLKLNAANSVKIPKHFRNSYFQVNPLLPISCWRFNSKELGNNIKLRKERIFLFDGLHTFAALSRNGLFCRESLPKDCKIIYRAHNTEFELWRRTAEQSNFCLKPILKVQEVLMRRFEASVCQQVDLVLTVSDRDKMSLKQLAPRTRFETLPIGFDFNLIPRPDNSKVELLFLGRLDWYPNRQGLSWFLDNVWPKVLATRKDISLTIAGSGQAEWLTSSKSLEAVKFVGEVEDKASFLQNSNILILPLFIGSGTRVKAIEASAQGLGCLSTAVGVEGLPLEQGKSYLRAESAEDWIDTLLQLELNQAKAIGEQAYLSLSSDFSTQEIGKKFSALLKEFEV